MVGAVAGGNFPLLLCCTGAAFIVGWAYGFLKGESRLIPEVSPEEITNWYVKMCA